MRPIAVAILLLIYTACLAQDNLPAEKMPTSPAPAASTPAQSYQDRAAEVLTAQRGPVTAEIFRAERLRRNTIGGLLIGFGIIFTIIAGIVISSSNCDTTCFCIFVWAIPMVMVIIGICYIAGSNREAMLYVIGRDPALWPR